MSKTKTLFTMALLVLLGSMGAAQAQDFADVKLFTTPKAAAREGGQNEVAGNILLNFSAGPAIGAPATVTLKFSAPLAANIPETTGVDDDAIMDDEEVAGGVELVGITDATVMGIAEDDNNDGNGTLVLSAINGLDATGDNLLIRGVRLDVSGSEGAVTVTVSVQPSADDFVRIDGSSTAMVIEDIQVGVAVSAKTKTARTRGTGGITAELTVEEGFKSAFMMGNRLAVEFSGIPDGATLEVEVTMPVADLRPIVDGERTGMNDMASPFAMVSSVNKDGEATVTLGGMDGLDPGGAGGQDMRAAPTEVILAVTLTADPDDDDADISFPLDRGSVTARATFTDGSNEANFLDAYSGSATVFNIRPAQCELLYPVVTVIPGTWDTALSVTNPAYEVEMASGGLTFTFYGMGGAEGDV